MKLWKVGSVITGAKLKRISCNDDGNIIVSPFRWMLSAQHTIDKKARFFYFMENRTHSQSPKSAKLELRKR